MGHIPVKRGSVEAVQSLRAAVDALEAGRLIVLHPEGTVTRDPDCAAAIAPRMPADRPRYLMGVGTPEDLLECVGAGVDMFDRVLPTRNARNGSLITSGGKIAIKNAKYAEDGGPLDPQCSCLTCRTISRAYLRHLFVSGEVAGLVYNTIHNVSFYLDLMRKVRQAIASNSFAAFREAFLLQLTRERES